MSEYQSTLNPLPFTHHIYEIREWSRRCLEENLATTQFNRIMEINDVVVVFAKMTETMIFSSQITSPL